MDMVHGIWKRRRREKEEETHGAKEAGASYGIACHVFGVQQIFTEYTAQHGSDSWMYM